MNAHQRRVARRRMSWSVKRINIELKTPVLRRRLPYGIQGSSFKWRHVDGVIRYGQFEFPVRDFTIDLHV